MIVGRETSLVAALSATTAQLTRRTSHATRRLPGFLEKYLAGNAALPMILSLVDRIIKANETAAKRKLYALALGSVFTIELGPLLTALLLAGRIGGSYAGEVSMMAATNQLDLLRILDVPAARWTFLPSLLAALLAAPVLTAAGTCTELGFDPSTSGSTRCPALPCSPPPAQKSLSRDRPLQGWRSTLALLSAGPPSSTWSHVTSIGPRCGRAFSSGGVAPVRCSVWIIRSLGASSSAASHFPELMYRSRYPQMCSSGRHSSTPIAASVSWRRR